MPANTRIVRGDSIWSDEFDATTTYASTLVESLTTAAVDIAWTQWSVMGSTAASRQRARSIIDPEALVLMTLYLSDREPRLHDVLHDWVSISSELLSTQRIRNLTNEYPWIVQERLSDLARTANGRGKDARWKKLAMGESGNSPQNLAPPRTNKLRAVQPSYAEPALLLLRLRLAFGVGIKADAIAQLLGLAGKGATVTTISQATGYQPSPLRRALADLVSANILETTRGQPTEYRLNADKWSAALNIDELPLWRDWTAQFQFVAALLDTVMRAKKRPQAWHELSAMLRDHLGTKRWAVEHNSVLTHTDSSLPKDWSRLLETEIHALIESMREEV